jgi:hypothetical protein
MHEAVGFQVPQPLRQHLGGYARDAGFQLAETKRAFGFQQPENVGGPWPHDHPQDAVHRALARRFDGHWRSDHLKQLTRTQIYTATHLLKPPPAKGG